jgi:hypothetical protein
VTTAWADRCRGEGAVSKQVKGSAKVVSLSNGLRICYFVIVIVSFFMLLVIKVTVYMLLLDRVSWLIAKLPNSLFGVLCHLGGICEHNAGARDVGAAPPSLKYVGK